MNPVTVRWARRAAIGLAVLLALAFGAAAFLLATFDANRYKGLVIDWMQTHKQRTLAIDGPVLLSVFPRLELRLSKVALGEHGRAVEFARLDEAALAIDLMPLLRKQLVVDRIELRGAQLRLTRDAQGRRNIDDLLEPSAPPRSAPTPAPQPEERASGLRFDVKAIELRDVRVMVDDVPGRLRGEATVRSWRSGALLGDTPAPLEFDIVLALQQPALQAAVKGKSRIAYDADSGTLRAEDLKLDGAGTLAGMKLDTVALALARLEHAPQRRTLQLEQLALELKGRRGGDPIEARLAWPRLQTVNETLQGSPLEGRLSIGGATPLRAAFEGHVEGALQAPRWQLAGALNDNRFTTEGSLSFAQPVIAIKAQGQFARLDLDRLLPPAAASAPAGAAPEAPLDLSLLRKLQGSVALRIGELVRRPYQLQEARLDATLANGTLRVTTLSGRIWGGRFDGSALADAAGPRFALQGTAQGVDVGAALRDVAKKDLLEGSGRLTVDLSASGRTAAELKSRLAGRAALSVRDGALKGINLARKLREAKALLAQRVDALQQARQTEKTDFSELSASFNVANGIARSTDLAVKSPLLRLGGEGTIDIPRNRLDAALKLSVVDTAAGQGGADLASLRGLTVPVALHGPLEAIDWQVQWSAVAAAAAQSAVRNKVEDKLKDALKGIFR